MNLSDISIFPATPSQIKVHRERTFEEWGRGLSREEYVKRDQAFEDLPHASNGKFVVWVLSSRHNASDNLDFFCSCETFQREAVASRGTGEDGGLVIAYSIASVFTPPHHRRQGYAKHMMRLLHCVLANPSKLPPFPTYEWGPPPGVPLGFGRGVASVLYSDVGPNFYKKCGKGLGHNDGWEVFRPVSTIWTVPREEPEGDPTSQEWVTEERQHTVWEKDSSIIEAEISKAHTPQFAFLPDQGVANYLQTRSHFYSSAKSTNDIWGVELTGPNSGLSFATWALDPGREGAQTLLITRLRCTPGELSRILQAAFNAARKFALEQVEIWNLDPSLRDIGENLLGGKTEERADHLPSLAWYGNCDVEWKYNEKFCWC